MLIYLLIGINPVTMLLEASHDAQMKPMADGVLGGQHNWGHCLSLLSLPPAPDPSHTGSTLRVLPESLRTSFISLGCQFLKGVGVITAISPQYPLKAGSGDRFLQLG